MFQSQGRFPAAAALLLLFVVFGNAAVQAEPKKSAAGKPAGERLSGPKLLARFPRADAQSSQSLFLYSDQQLKAVHAWQHGRWVPVKSTAYDHPGEAYFAYRVTSKLTPTAGRTILVNSWSEDGQHTFRHRLTVGNEATVDVELQTVRTRKQHEVAAAERAAKRATGDPHGFIPLLNQYRASRGLGPVTHDPALSQDAQRNNAMGSGHAFMGGARVQNWADGFSSAADVLRGWQNSPGHNRNLLDPGITRGGIARDNAEWTFNGS